MINVTPALPAIAFHALLVDDDDVDRERLSRLLRKYSKNINITEASSKKIAMQELSRHTTPFSFVFLDFKLEDGDGRELLPQIRASSGEDCIVVAVTGYGNEHEAAEAIKLGINDYLSKSDLSANKIEAAIHAGLTQVELMRRMRQAENEVLHKSMYDELTDLPNRHIFFDRLTQCCALFHRETSYFAVMMIDLDKFKQVNDEFGHAIGDRLLLEIANRLKNTVRDVDTVARLGGDEFAVILLGISSGDIALKLANKLLGTLRLPIVVGTISLSIDASVGIAICPQDGVEPKNLLKHADEAMYKGKRSLDKIVVYEKQDFAEDKFWDRMALLGDVERAMEHAEIQWHWQPKVNLVTRQVEGFETLARWFHPIRGQVPPDVFIPVIETSSLILPFTLATARNMVQHIARLGARLQGIRVSFNVSARVLEHASFVDELLFCINENRIDPSQIVLELTETALIENPTKARNVIDRLAVHGVSLSIDDFGAGFTSFGYLRDFNVREIKIDSSYVLSLLDNQFNRSLVSCLTVFCDSLGIRLVAEGVETEQCWQMLCSLGCHYGQGYGIGRPMPVSAVADWLDAWHKPGIM